jgi:hypothetical protein
MGMGEREPIRAKSQEPRVSASVSSLLTEQWCPRSTKCVLGLEMQI